MACDSHTWAWEFWRGGAAKQLRVGRTVNADRSPDAEDHGQTGEVIALDWTHERADVKWNDGHRGWCESKYLEVV